ncbi:hypothetical protein P153DRAFT_391144 [Dothidotthia symphoricarpi CBS 119687]|uniref:Uncharacterized protein n=1 Tax=Dothidotthia symphoricarpi CBS 119687 TaxID=1392245 RepID=A0A6A5ZY73_9PLEO|nr:uncharacterized protein P153DRAFT_391144 [Dothidotthia symphoricarpi CBS 119687]KAF2123727.1 hypothetical protein P153DRAFT_391144 [Dothidotthia symphoricarpi CBS 119687]
MSVFNDVEMSTVLHDIQCMSFCLRLKVYKRAQTNANVSRKTIVIFGAGRHLNLEQEDEEDKDHALQHEHELLQAGVRNHEQVQELALLQGLV